MTWRVTRAGCDFKLYNTTAERVNFVLPYKVTLGLLSENNFEDI